MMQSSDYFEGIRSAGYVKKILDGFYQTQTNLFNYFAQEIYNKEPKEIRDFLLDCAVLEWLTPALCIAVTKHQNAGKVLSTIAKRNSFLIKMPDQSYRFHNLFRDFLRSKLTNIGRERRILQRAAVFYTRQGRSEEAIKCYLQASNYVRAGALIIKAGSGFIEQGKSAVLCSYIEQIPVQQRRMRPGLHTLYAQALINTGRSDEATKGLHAACRIFKEKRSKHIQYAKALYELGGLSLNAGKFSAAKSWFKRALVVCPKSPNITRAAILNSLGFVYTNIGGRSLNQATEFFNKALRIAQQKQYKDLEASIYNNWATNEMKAGYLNKAYSKLSRMVSFLGSHFSPHCGSGFFNAARLSLLLGYKDEAKAILDAGVKVCSTYNDMWSMAALWKGYAFYYQDLREWDKARRYISKALEIYEKLGIVRLLTTALNEVCKINIATDELSEAEKNIAAIWWFKKSKDDAEALPLLITHAKLKREQNRLEEAEDMLTAALSTARRFKQIFNQFLIYIELSKVLYTAGQSEKLVLALQKAVQLSRDKGYDYAMLNELKGQRWMLQVIKRQNIEKQYIHGLIRDQRLDIHWIEALFLGTPALVINGRSMPDKVWKTENAKKLFFYLLLHKNKKLSSDHLVDVFWHRALYSTGRNNLRKTIQYMRESLGDMFGKEMDIVVSGKRSYSISPSVTIVLDLEEFERLIKQATSLSGDIEEQRVLLQKALLLYKEGFAQGWFDTWVDERRDFYQGLYEDCLVMMADSYFCQDKYRQAIVWYEKLISINIYNEQYHCKLMQTYAKLGKFKDIVRDYENLTKTLKKELGTKPQKETTNLHNRLVN
jgi:DNA-binding SARP family transcriptional activator/predicted Zn-dependent protease